MQEKKQEIYKIHCFYMGKIKKNDNLIIKDLMSSYKSRDLGYNLKNSKKITYKILSRKQVTFLVVSICQISSSDSSSKEHSPSFTKILPK